MNRKARVLVALWDGGGVVPPVLSVARRLVARGHAVHVLGDPTIEAEARAAGCDFRPWVRAPHRTTRDRSADILNDYAAESRMKYLEEVVGGYIFKPGRNWTGDVLEAIDQLGIDLVLTDFMVPWGIVAAERRGLPGVVLSTTVYSIPTPGMAPPGASMMRVPGFLERPRDWMLRRGMEWAFDKFLGDVNSVRAELDLPLLDHTLDQSRRADAILVLSSRSFDLGGKGVPDNVHWVGAPMDDPSWTAPWASPWAADDPRPLVLVGLSSTFQDQVPLLGRLVTALSDLPVRGLVTLGPALQPQEVPSRGNVVVVPSVPHGQVLPHTAVLVTHCGHGTTLKGLAAGVPMLCVPMGRDQDENAARVAGLGAGLVLSPKAPTDKLRAALQRLLTDEGLREGARRAATAIARREGERDPVELIESLLPAAPSGRTAPGPEARAEARL